MAEVGREGARERLDRAREAAGLRLYGPTFVAFCAAYVLVDVAVVRRWSVQDGTLIVPLGALAAFTVLADWRQWDRSLPLRWAVVAVATLLGVAAALLTGNRW